jgi:hypothetical protein
VERRNRFDYIDNTSHQTTALDRAQKDWYDKVKALPVGMAGNQEIGAQIYGPKPGTEIKETTMQEPKEINQTIDPTAFEVKNDFIPPSVQQEKAILWDGGQMERDFIVARQEGSTPSNNPSETDIDGEGTMNDLYS